jgi:hypothetical protein
MTREMGSQVVQRSLTSKEFPKREKGRRGKCKIRIMYPLHMCARTLTTIVPIATLMITQNKIVGSCIPRKTSKIDPRRIS